MLEVGEPGLVAGGEAAQTVELGVVAGADVVSVLQVVGQLVREPVRAVEPLRLDFQRRGQFAN